MMRDYPYTETRHRVLRDVADGKYLRKALNGNVGRKFCRASLPGQHRPISGAEGNTLNRFWDAGFLREALALDAEDATYLVRLSVSGVVLLRKWNEGSKGNDDGDPANDTCVPGP